MCAWSNGILAEGIATAEEIQAIHAKAKKSTPDSRDRAWKAFQAPIQERLSALKAMVKGFPDQDLITAALKVENP